jgi:hypothetical protein
MRGSLMAILAFFCLAVAAGRIFSAPVDLRDYIDTNRTYANSDSMEFTDVGSASYAGSSDTIVINGCELISCDFILSRNGKATANCAIQLQGSKDKVHFVNLDSNNASVTVTAASATVATTLTFPYVPAYSYYRLYVDNDTTFSAICKWKVGGKTYAR